jgi:hypothetical protein
MREAQSNSASRSRVTPSPSIERTRKGKARYACSPFSASRALPSRAFHVKRQAIEVNHKNPYGPPAAEVAAASSHTTRDALQARPPRAAFVAGVFVAVSLVLAAAKVSLLTFWHSPILQVLSGLLYLSLACIAMSSVYKARNWVRWCMVFLGLLALFGLLGLHEGMPLFTLVLHITQGVLLGAASALLLLPSSKRWFVRRACP